MLEGLDGDQEHRVMDNALWLVSCGKVYFAARVGMSCKADAWHAFTDDDGDRWLCWLLWNDRDVQSLESHNTALARLRGQR